MAKTYISVFLFKNLGRRAAEILSGINFAARKVTLQETKLQNHPLRNGIFFNKYNTSPSATKKDKQNMLLAYLQDKVEKLNDKLKIKLAELDKQITTSISANNSKEKIQDQINMKSLTATQIITLSDFNKHLTEMHRKPINMNEDEIDEQTKSLIQSYVKIAEKDNDPMLVNFFSNLAEKLEEKTQLSFGYK